MQVSSAYRLEAASFSDSSISLIKTKKNLGPKIGPCETLQVVLPSSEERPTRETKNFLTER